MIWRLLGKIDRAGSLAGKRCCISCLKECIRFVINFYTGKSKQTGNKVERQTQQGMVFYDAN